VTREAAPETPARAQGPLIEEPESLLSLERAEEAWLDRLLPAKPRPFLAVALGVPIAVWVAALVLAPDRGRFLASREWQAQPLYLAAHVVFVRLFVTSYLRNFLAATSYLEMPQGEARRRAHRVLGPIGFLLALAVAAPLAAADVEYLRGKEWMGSADFQGVEGRLGAVDVLLGAMWTAEWILNAYVWVLVVGFLWLSMRVLRRHPWKADLETVLHERHYRPFLMMSAQGASVVLGFTIATAAYIAYTHGETTDYVGLWTTGGLLVFGFVPPWLRLKNDLARRMRADVHRLRSSVIDARRARRRVDDESPPTTTEELGVRLDVVLALLEVDHLERLYRDVGRSEGQAILLRLLAPLSTVVWRFLRF
jgi:hypothetical protein